MGTEITNTTSLRKGRRPLAVFDPRQNKVIECGPHDEAYKLAQSGTLGYRMATEEETAPKYVVNPCGVISPVNWNDTEGLVRARIHAVDDEHIDKDGNPIPWRMATPAEIEAYKAKGEIERAANEKIRADRKEKLAAREQLRAMLGLGGDLK